MELNKILGIAIGAIAVVIVSGTLVALIMQKRPGQNLRNADPAPGEVVNMSAPKDGKLAAFTGLGRLRTVTKPDSSKKNDTGTPVVITPWFTYPEGDTAFYEELARKSKLLAAVFSQYFANYTERQLRTRGEEQIKKEITDELNARLSLGKISGVYFTEYIFLE